MLFHQPKDLHTIQAALHLLYGVPNKSHCFNGRKAECCHICRNTYKAEISSTRVTLAASLQALGSLSLSLSFTTICSHSNPLVSVSHACFSDGNKLQAGCTKKPWPQGDCLIDVLLSMASTSNTKQTLQA